MSTSFFKLATPLRARLQQELQPGETVIWAGTPDWRAKWRDLAAISCFALFWNVIAGTFLFVSAAAALGLVPADKMKGGFATGWGPYALLLFMVPFVLIGLGLLWHIVCELRSGRRRVHAVTDRRVLTVEIGNAKPLDDRPRSEINFVRSTERADGSGTLVIAVGVVRDVDGDPRPQTLTWPGIPDVAFVQATLDRRATAAATASGRAPEQRVVPSALADLPATLARAAERETRGERIAWVGRPDAVYAAKWAMLAWLVAVPWLWFTLKWELTSLGLLAQEVARGKSQTPITFLGVFSLWGLPFIAVGLSILATPLWVWRMAKATVHIITDRRIVTVRRRRGAIQVSNVEPSRILSVSRQTVHGRGSIRMVLGKTTDSDGDVTDLTEHIWLVQDAERAEALIEALRGRDDRRAA
jgi:hypothetical protein